MPISNLWKKRIAKFQERGNNFTYGEIAEMAEVSRGNVSVVIRKMAEDYPEVVERTKGDDGRVRYIFNYAAIIDDVPDTQAPDIPEWMSPTTYTNLVERLAATDNIEMKFEHLDWTRQFQRGGIRVFVYESGQKYPEYSKVFRLDNCIVIAGHAPE